MTPINQLEQIKQAIKTLESMEESTTESFRIVILNLKQKKTALEKQMVQPRK